MAEAFADDVAAEMGNRVEQGHALGLASYGDVEWTDDIFQLCLQHFGGAAQGGFDAFLVPLDERIELLQRQRVGGALLVWSILTPSRRASAVSTIEAVHEEHADQATQVGQFGDPRSAPFRRWALDIRRSAPKP